MSEAFIGEIRAFSFGYVPMYWAECSGQILLIAQNQVLFALLGTQYGGNGQTTFALPDLRNRGSIGQGQAPGQAEFKTVGQTGGAESVALTTSQMPLHTHGVRAGGTPTTANPSGATWATTANAAYGPPADTAMAPQAVGSSGSGQPHQNMPPHLAVVFAIALDGIFPSRN